MTFSVIKLMYVLSLLGLFMGAIAINDMVYFLIAIAIAWLVAIMGLWDGSYI